MMPVVLPSALQGNIKLPVDEKEGPARIVMIHCSLLVREQHSRV